MKRLDVVEPDKTHRRVTFIPNFEGGIAMLRKFILTCLLGFALAGNCGAASVRPLQLDEIVDGAAIAFQGTCLGNRSERDAATNLVVTYTRFRVNEVLKGSLPATYEIKQIGGVLGDLVYRADGIPNFVAGEEYVVMLPGVSAAGFSSPVGLGQGKFTVTPGAAGGRVANGRDFREMTAGIADASLPAALVAKAQAAKVRDLDLVEFKQLVRARAARAK